MIFTRQTAKSFFYIFRRGIPGHIQDLIIVFEFQADVPLFVDVIGYVIRNSAGKATCQALEILMNKHIFGIWSCWPASRLGMMPNLIQKEKGAQL
jgi:hypothetical protein